MTTGILNPDMLLTARNYSGISQSEVSKKCKISQARYSKIEGGVNVIQRDDPLVDQFSQVLNFPKSFFFKDGRALGVPASFHEMFRKSKSVGGKKTLSQISADLTIKMLCISHLLNSVQIEPELTIPHYDADDYGGDGAEIARMVKRTWMVPDGPVLNLTEIVERAGIIVFDSYFPAPRVDGVTVNIAGLPPVIFLNSSSSADRARFSLAHELGHVIMHRQMSHTMEEEANAFAAEFLMPEKEMRLEFGQRVDMKELARLKRIRKTSMAALLYRAGDIGKISKGQSAYLWRQMAKYRMDEPESTRFEREKPTTLPSMMKLLSEKLDYSLSDFAASFDLFEDLTRLMFAKSLPVERKLKLVIG